MHAVEKQFEPFYQRMKEANLPEIFINNFQHQYLKLLRGDTGRIPEAEIQPVSELPDSDHLGKRYQVTGEAHFSKSVFLKLNGGLGTSMGLERAKSLLTVKENLTFLDIIARQSLQGGFRLLLMNSFSTRQDSLEFLRKYPELHNDIPLDFLQHKAPKVLEKNLSPAVWPDNPKLTWCPPGHGDLYIALYSSGILDLLLQEGYEYAFISNADNLGAVLDAQILGYFIENELPFMMEVADRTDADKKGGHLAQRVNGQLILREIAQCPEGDLKFFQDVQRHRYFNTNNLWVNLRTLTELLRQQDFILDLPMICNQKNLDPRDPTSSPVFQIETAAGSAISVFKNSAAMRVPRTRFAPVKNTNDLLAVRSDRYSISKDFKIVPIPSQKENALEVDLDSRFYKLIDDFEVRFPDGVPSLKNCTSLVIKGDVLFENNISLNGQVKIINRTSEQVKLHTGTIIDGEYIINSPLPKR